MESGNEMDIAVNVCMENEMESESETENQVESGSENEVASGKSKKKILEAGKTLP